MPTVESLPAELVDGWNAVTKAVEAIAIAGAVIPTIKRMCAMAVQMDPSLKDALDYVGATCDTIELAQHQLVWLASLAPQIQGVVTEARQRQAGS